LRFFWVMYWVRWIGYQPFAGQVQWWECHLKPLDRLAGPTLVWSLPFDLISLVRPIRGLCPHWHHSQDPRDMQAHNITSKAALCYGSEVWIVNKRDSQKLEAAQMRFLRPLLGLTRLDRQRNTDIHNRLKVDNMLKNIISY
jgi:hypothetical protein